MLTKILRITLIGGLALGLLHGQADSARIVANTEQLTAR